MKRRRRRGGGGGAGVNQWESDNDGGSTSEKISESAHYTLNILRCVRLYIKRKYYYKFKWLAFFVHDLLQLFIQILSPLLQRFRPLLPQHRQVLLLVAVQTLLKFRPGTHASDRDVVDRFADDWQGTRVLHRLYLYQNATRMTLKATSQFIGCQLI